jgi:hypothetical protein
MGCAHLQVRGPTGSSIIVAIEVMSWLLQKVGLFPSSAGGSLPPVVELESSSPASLTESEPLDGPSAAPLCAFPIPADPEVLPENLCSDSTKSPGLSQGSPQIGNMSTSLYTAEIISRHFSTFEQGLLPYIQNIAVKSGFALARKAHSMNKDRAREVFDQELALQRGHFYCLSGVKAESRCPFRIPFTFDFQSSQYIIKENGLNLTHNHASAPTIVDGILFKVKDCDLTSKTHLLFIYVKILNLNQVKRSTPSLNCPLTSPLELCVGSCGIGGLMSVLTHSCSIG